jgi:glucosamine 6-phosphate synthetase-like amidotransferase/phosphosugar isomerase protein
MCGIIGGISKKNRRIGKKLLEKYEIQKSRGREGFGYCALDNGLVRVERFEQEDLFKSKMKHEQSPFVIAHHRFPTSTINVVECTHPIHVSHEELDYDYYVVHNGVLRNEDELKKKHEGYSTPYKYTTELVYSSKSSYISKHTQQEYRLMIVKV